MAQDLNKWIPIYYQDYAQKAQSAGMTPLSQDQWQQKYYAGGFTDDTNFAQGQIAYTKDTTNYGNNAQQNNLKNTVNALPGNPTTLANNAAFKPNSEIQQAEALIQNQIKNPVQLTPDTVQTWEQFINQANAPLQAQSNAALNAQYAGLGNLGGSANRSALATAAANTNAQTASQALGIAQSQQQNTQNVGQQNVSNLMSVGQNNQNLALIPLQQQFQDYMQQQGQQGQQAQTLLQSNLTEQQQEQQMAEMEQMIKANQPKAQDWYQTLVNGALGGLGMGLGSLATGGLGSLFGASSAASSGLGSQLSLGNSNVNFLNPQGLGQQFMNQGNKSYFG